MSAPVTEVRLKLGELLEQAGLVEHAKLEEALKRQTARNERLGDLLVAMRLIDEVELRAVLELQAFLRGGRSGEIAAWLGKRFGAILVDSALVTPEQLEDAIQEQERGGGPLGEILVRRGALTPAQRDGALGFQRALGSGGITDCFRLGRMLVDAGVIDEATLDDAVRRQKERGGRLGEALVENGAIDRSTLEQFLLRQRRIVAAALAGLSLIGATVPKPARAGSSLDVKVQVRVAKHASIRAVRNPAEIVITAADIARGYVELGEPVEVDVRTNDPNGFMLGFNLNSPMLKRAQLSGVGLNVGIGMNGGNVSLAKYATGAGAHTVQLRARLELSEQAVPGRLAWPMTVYIAPA